jgi:hypothetical protein
MVWIFLFAASLEEARVGVEFLEKALLPDA